MFKKIIPYIIVIILSVIISYFIFSGNNTDIKNTVSQLVTITNEIRESQREVNNSIESIGNTINGIRETTSTLSRGIEQSEIRSQRIENRIEQLQRINNDNIEKLGLLITGNNNIKGASEEIGQLNTEFKGILESIEKGNK